MGFQVHFLLAVFFSVCAVSWSHPKQIVGDSTPARLLFNRLTNGTEGKLTIADFQRFFADFDTNGDKTLTSDEFLQHWVQFGVGSPLDSVIFFHNVDVNKDGVLTMDRDLYGTFNTFDRDGNNYVDAGEFVVQWVKLSGI